jgi:hypothetical protein
MEIAPTPVHRSRIDGPTAWKGADFASASQWCYRLTPGAVAEFERSLRRIQRSSKPVAELAAGDFDVPSFLGDAGTLGREIRSGRGFVLIKGLPLERYSDEEACILYRGFGALLGKAVPQNVKGDVLYSVRNEGVNLEREYGSIGARSSKTALGINFHTDSAPIMAGFCPDIVGLLALRTAKSGGESAIISAATLHNILLEERPDLLKRLYAPYHFDRRAELRPGEAPTLFAPVFIYRGGVAIRYLRFYIHKGHELVGAPLTPADVEPLDYMDSVMTRPELRVTFGMEPGDMQFINNVFILHSRTAFEDHAEPDRRRHLVRLWLE